MKKGTIMAKGIVAATIVAIVAGLVVALFSATAFPRNRATDRLDAADDEDDDEHENDELNDTDTKQRQQQLSTKNSRLNFLSCRCNEITKTNHDDMAAFSDTATLPTSKKGRKKQLKYERKVQNRKMKKQKARQKRHEEAISMGRNIQKEQELVAQRTMIGDGWRRRQTIWETEKLSSVQESFHICIDCSYEQYMTNKEIASLAAQIRCCYAYNKRNDQPCRMMVTNLSMQQSPQTLQLLQLEKGYHEWPNRAYDSTSLSPHEYYSSSSNTRMVESCNAAATTTTKRRRISNIVYLTSDSNTTLATLENDTVYVIGGIVDRNRYKGIAYTRALELANGRHRPGIVNDDDDNDATIVSISTARLPLMEYIAHMPSTPVLTINHVFHILLQYRNNNNDWNAAFQAVLPARKEAQYIYSRN